jgi:NADH:ubiquinone reductase (H+-translocating)
MNMPSNQPRIVIVGGGFAGMRVAKALSGRGATITLVDRHNYHVFQPLLYQVATAVLSPGDIAAPLRHILRRQRDGLITRDDLVWNTPPAAAPPRVERRQAFRRA